jgi:plastocyanin
MKAKTHNIGRKYLAMPVVFCLLFFYSSCSKSSDNNPGSGTPGANEVWLQGSAFNPAIRTIPVNTTLKWTNKDSYAHTVTSDSTMFNSGNLSANGTFSFTFTKKGTYKYHCNIHSMMKAEVVVQ